MTAPELSWRSGTDEVRSAARRQMVKSLRAASRRPYAAVLLLGPPGAGRQHAARLLHEMTHAVREPDAPLVEFRPGEGEGKEVVDLFGSERHPSASGRTSQPGMLERAQGGTLIIRDLADLSEASQARLVRLLETRCFRRAGGAREIRAHVRIVGISRQEMGRMVESGRFRKDLYRRLVTILVPSVASTPEDIAGLARSFLHSLAARTGQKGWSLSPSALKMLESYGFPGNMLELRNIVEHAAILAKDQEITEREIVLPNGHGPTKSPFFSIEEAPDGSPPPLEQVERAYVARVLMHVGGRRQAAAQMLGVSYPTFLKRLREIENEQRLGANGAAIVHGEQGSTRS